MGLNQIAFPGQAAAARVAVFQQNSGQQAISQAYGGAFDISLAPGQAILLPAGQWLTQAGPYSDIQYWDSQSQMWRNLFAAADAAPIPISADGTNYRFVNLSGCAVGAVVTTAGTSNGATTTSMYTPSGVWTGGVFTAGTPAIITTASSGGATFNTFIGGAISSITTGWISAGGTGYAVAPKLLVIPPASQGSQPFIPATLTCTISGGAINAVTVTNQGAGYVAPPTVLVLNQPGDTTGAGGAVTIPVSSMTGAGQVTAVTLATPGAAQSAVPTLSFSGASAPASAAATILMNFSVVAGGTATAGSGYTNGYSLKAINGIATATPTYTNPAIERGITIPSDPVIFNNSATVVAITAPMIAFGGIGFQTVPNLAAIGIGTGGGITSTAVGGTADTCLLYPI